MAPRRCEPPHVKTIQCCHNLDWICMVVYFKPLLLGDNFYHRLQAEFTPKKIGINPIVFIFIPW